jgi:hypothetical protein
MKRFIFMMLFLAAMAASPLRAQNTEGESAVDSLVYVRAASMDASLAGKNVFNYVTVHQSQAIADAMSRKIERNRDKRMTGYRVRIFFDNKQNSRAASEAAMGRFQSAYPGHGVYRSFASPYFKVTVGDFRTKSEALQMMRRIKADFPSAFVVKENINYPIVDRNHAYVVDTLSVSRP